MSLYVIFKNHRIHSSDTETHRLTTDQSNKAEPLMLWLMCIRLVLLLPLFRHCQRESQLITLSTSSHAIHIHYAIHLHSHDVFGQTHALSKLLAPLPFFNNTAIEMFNIMILNMHLNHHMPAPSYKIPDFVSYLTLKWTQDGLNIAIKAFPGWIIGCFLAVPMAYL